MFQLRDRKPADGEQTRYVNMADWEIAEAIAERNGLKSEVDRGRRDARPRSCRRTRTTRTFLMERAKRIDFDCFVLTDPKSGEARCTSSSPPTAARTGRSASTSSCWGESLIQFTPTINLSRQVGSVTVRGWDDRTKQAIVATAKPEDLPGAGRTGRRTAGRSGRQEHARGKQEVVVDAPVTSERGGAQSLALSLLGGARLRVHHRHRPGDRPARPAAGRQRRAGSERRTLQRTLLRQEGRALDRRQRLQHRFRSASAASGNQIMSLPRSRTTDQRFYGVFEGIVTRVGDELQEGLIKVTLPWLDSHTESDWSPIVQLLAGPGHGSLLRSRGRAAWCSAPPAMAICESW